LASKKKILVLYAHPKHWQSKANAPLAAVGRAVSGVTLIDLYATYPTLDIDVRAEQEQLAAHDIIIFQFPMYWYSTPAILKEWQDLVLEYGFAYGRDGKALHGKTFLCAVTAGGPAHVYAGGDAMSDDEGDVENGGMDIRRLLLPIEQMARLCGMHFLPPFILFGARTALKDQRIEDHMREWENLLTALRDQRFDMAAADSMTLLTGRLPLIAHKGNKA